MHKSDSRISAAVRGGTFSQRFQVPSGMGEPGETEGGKPGTYCYNLVEVETGSPRWWEWWGGSDGTPVDATGCEFPSCVVSALDSRPARSCALSAAQPAAASQFLSFLSRPSPTLEKVSGHSWAVATAKVPVVTVTHRRFCSATCCSELCSQNHPNLTPLGLDSSSQRSQPDLPHPQSSPRIAYDICQPPVPFVPPRVAHWISNWSIACHPIRAYTSLLSIANLVSVSSTYNPKSRAFRCYRLLPRNSAPAPSPFPMGVGLSKIWERSVRVKKRCKIGLGLVHPIC
ncbi:hypothetical protein QR685DRAFT_313618 [Neurospora intermedia]|uniref:Uncharacterized protein n=1 Tax=Neurospora intermedia TaxID=5142 RepID=A0ABR3DAG0_NEUIN